MKKHNPGLGDLKNAVNSLKSENRKRMDFLTSSVKRLKEQGKSRHSALTFVVRNTNWSYTECCDFLTRQFWFK